MTDDDDEWNKIKRFHNFKEQVSMREFREALRSRYKLPIASDRMFEDLLRKLDEADRHRDQERACVDHQRLIESTTNGSSLT